MPRIRIAVVCAAALALVAVASAAAATWPQVKPNAADQALATKSVLHITDFAPGLGWKAAKAGSSGGSSAAVPSCSGPAFSDVGRVLTGSASTSFEAPGIKVWSEADVMQTAAMATQDQKMASNPGMLRCLRDAFQHESPAGVRLVSAQRLSFPSTGNWSTAFRALLDVTVNGTTIRMQTDVVLVLNNRVEITLMQMAPYSISASAKASEVRMVQHLVFSALTA